MPCHAMSWDVYGVGLVPAVHATSTHPADAQSVPLGPHASTHWANGGWTAWLLTTRMHACGKPWAIRLATALASASGRDDEDPALSAAW
jgi:hypothetical protein